MSEHDHSRIFESLGAYALGALPEGERAAVTAHVADCPICAEDADALQRTATRLIEVVPVVEPPPELGRRIMAVVEPEAALLRAAAGERTPVTAPRRERRWAGALSLRWVATAATLLVLGGVVGATALSGGGGPGTRTLAAEVGSGHAWVEVSGQQAHLVVAGLRSPARERVYEMWIQHGDETPRPASANLADAVFVVRNGRVEIPARLGPGDRIMVTEEKAGGSRTPTTIPVVITSRV